MEIGGVAIELGQPFEFWGLCAGLLVSYFWTLRRHRRTFAPGSEEKAATGWQKFSFTAGVLSLLAVSGTPWHDIGEQGLFFFHTIEHMTHAFVVAPLLLVGTPGWMFRLLLRNRPVRWVVTNLGRPLPAALVFNAAFALLHWPAIVDRMLQAPQVHGGVHLVWLATALLMWLPVASPDQELAPRLSPLAQMGYLLVMTILPTVPSSFLTFGEEPAYRVYEAMPRMWGIPAVEDMQIAGLVMKIGGGFQLWGIIAVMFFRWAAVENRKENAHRRGGGGSRPVDAPTSDLPGGTGAPVPDAAPPVPVA